MKNETNAQAASTGKIGEDLASKFLIGIGHRIISRNYRRPWGEIDIITIAPDKTLVFVEVKTMKSGELAELSPEDNMTNAKIIKLRKTCEAFSKTNERLIDEERGWRIDLVAISIPHDVDLTKNINNVSIKHYENVA